MTLTAKASSTARFANTQGFRGNGSQEPAFQVGGPRGKVTYSAVWDDSVDGHIPAAGSMGLGVWVPNGFVVTNVYFDVEVVPVGPTNMFMSLVDDGDLTASAAIAGAPWSTVGIKHGANVDAGAVNVASTVQGPLVVAAREIAIGGTGATSSAGRVVVVVEGFLRPTTQTQGAAI